MGSSWITVSGEIDVATAPDLVVALRDAQASALVVLDLSEVTFIDAAGIRLLVDATTRAHNVGHRLVLARPTQVVTDALAHVGATGLVEHFDAVPVKPGAVTDEQLMAQVATGNSVAFGQLYDRLGPRAHRVAYSICRNTSTAEDAVQDAFLSVWKSRTTYKAHRGGVAAWLLMIVRNKAIDNVRMRSASDGRRASADALDACPDASDVVAEAVARDEQAAVRAQLSSLPAGQLEVISLAFFGELSQVEIAARLDLPVGTVKSRMRLGLTRLRSAAVQ